MRSRHFALCLLLLSPSSGVAQGFSQTIFTQGGMGSPGLFTSLLEPTHVVTVRALTSSKTAFTIRFSREGWPEKTISQSSSVETLEARFVSHLQAGRSYRYPQVVLELLGKGPAFDIVRSMAGKPLESLSSEKPFRAVVLDQGFSETHYTIILQEADGSLRHLQGAFETDRIRKQAKLLSRGRSFEFPAVLEDALLTEEQRAQRAKPENEATAALYRYLGEWRGGIEGNPNAKIDMACHARPDGSGIWREITFTDGTEELPPLPDIQIVEYDGSAQAYLAGSLAEGSPPPLRSTWDEASRTFTSILPVDDDGLKRVNTATFTREDRIDWKTSTQSQNGEVKTISAGHYDRVRVPDDGESDVLPPTNYEIQGAAGFFSNSFALKPSELSTCEPFRAEIKSISLQDDSIEIQFRHANGTSDTQRERRSGIGKSDLAKALAQLKEGQVYEFPFCIQHPGQPEVGKPTTPAMKALEPFIGKWCRKIRDEHGKLYDSMNMALRCFWSADGTALWFESHTPGGQGTDMTGKVVSLPAQTSLVRISHDPDTGEYTESVGRHGSLQKRVRATWDKEKRAYSWKGVVSQSHGIEGEGVRTFITADKIEWQSRHRRSDGTLANEFSGYYERIKD